jgi:hypothetical protein
MAAGCWGLSFAGSCPSDMLAVKQVRIAKRDRFFFILIEKTTGSMI